MLVPIKVLRASNSQVLGFSESLLPIVSIDDPKTHAYDGREGHLIESTELEGTSSFVRFGDQSVVVPNLKRPSLNGETVVPYDSKLLQESRSPEFNLLDVLATLEGESLLV